MDIKQDNLNYTSSSDFDKRILVIRLSAFGDVAMTIPVLVSLAKKFPTTEITFLSRKGFAPLFSNLPANIRFFGVDFKKDFNGRKGLEKLFKILSEENFDHIADLHGVLRTFYLDLRFRFSGKKVAVIDKGRDEKKLLTRKRNKVFKPLKTSFTRYIEVFNKLGYNFEPNFSSVFENKIPSTNIISKIAGVKSERWLGIAPFAKHKGKIYPLELQKKVIAHFVAEKAIKIFIFGGGKEEQSIVEHWQAEYPSIVSLVGALNMEEELVLMSQLDLMITMDSANMHLASLVGTRVISIWGATHPYAGFMGWNQSETDAIQINLTCRPCSIFGNKPCYRNDYACMYGISPNMIIEKIEKCLSK